MDALELLKKDHQKVKELFEQGQQTKDKKQQKQIFKEIKSELETHARIEETVLSCHGRTRRAKGNGARVYRRAQASEDGSSRDGPALAQQRKVQAEVQGLKGQRRAPC
jgi:hypothetical protein